MTAPTYHLDPADPRAPSPAQWDAMSDEERLRVVDSLPSEFPLTSPPEGDPHRVPTARALETLEEYFRRRGRSVYLSSGLPVYYPDESMFAPDLIAVVDVPSHEREKWVVSAEGRGLDFALEVHLSGDRQKDLERNVERFARLGIPEYFVFMPRRARLIGYVLREGETSYTPLVPQGGLWPSSMLGLDLGLDGGRLRFYHAAAPLPDARELIDRLSSMVDGAVERAEEEARRAEEEARRAEDEARRAEEEARRVEETERRAERYAAKLRELGVDPDALE